MTRPPQWFLDAAREQATPDPVAIDMAGPPADDFPLGLYVPERPRSGMIVVYVVAAVLIVGLALVGIALFVTLR